LAKVDFVAVGKDMIDGTIVIALEHDVAGLAALVKDVARNHLDTRHRIKHVVENDGLLGLGPGGSQRI
jgi:hypothetical protein